MEKEEEIYKLVKSNNKMLRSLKRTAFWGRIFKLLIYAAMLGIPLYLYFTVFQPILGDLIGTYEQIQTTTNSIPNLQDLLKGIPGGN